MSSVVSQEIMGKYNSKYSSDGDVFLDVSDFASGEKIYILVTTNSVCSNTNLEYKFYESFTQHFDTDALEHVSYSSSTTKNGKKEYNYEITKPIGGYDDYF